MEWRDCILSELEDYLSEPSLMFKWLFHILIFATKPLKRQRTRGLEDYVVETKRFITQEQCQ